MGKKLQEIPELYKQTCQLLMTKTNATCDWLKNIKANQKVDLEEEELKQQLEQHINEGESLGKQLEETKNLQEKKIEEILLEIKTKFHIHELMRSGDDKNNVDLEERLENLVSENAEMARKLKQITEELENERDKSNNLKDRKSTQDIQLKGARQRLRDMETKLGTDEIRIAQLLSQMKVLEGQLKIKESSFEHKAKELQKLNKATGEQVAKLEKQRNIHEHRMAAEAEIQACQKRMQKVEEKGRQLAEMAEKTKSIVVSGDESKHSEREVELWTELQSTRVLLKSAETQIQQLKDEKIKFMETIKQAAQEDDGNVREICKKYGAELIQRNEQICQLQEQVKELLNTVENSQKQNALLETRVKEYQDMINAQKEDKSSASVQIQVSELQQKLIDLQATMTEVLCQNEQLEQALTQKQLEVEQRDRVMREQSKVLKVRDELIGLLKGKEQRQDDQITSLQSTLDEREKNVDKVNKEISAKAEEMQELYSTLESKQIQVIRLEKLVKQLEEQHERGQAQRTRHEARIAQLEHALQEKRNQRGSKFLFL